MKYRVIYGLLLFIVLPSFCTAASTAPTNITLSVDMNTITVAWVGESDTDEYVVYWGISSNNLNTNARIDDSITEYTITGLDLGTTYYIAVSSVDGSSESEKSETQSITISSDIEAPATPEGLKITSVNDITMSTISLKWNKNSESDLDHYNIRYGMASGSYDSVVEAQSSDTSQFTLSGLANSQRYYFTISAVDVSGNESANVDELIVDTQEDNLPPYRPGGISGTLSNANEITIDILNGNSQMADYAGNQIYYGNLSGNLDNVMDIGKKFSFVLSDLANGTTWYFAASSYDHNGNESTLTSEISVSTSEDGGSSCFISTILQ